MGRSRTDTKRRPAQHKLGAASSNEVRQVREAARELLDGYARRGDDTLCEQVGGKRSRIECLTVTNLRWNIDQGVRAAHESPVVGEVCTVALEDPAGNE